MAEKLAKLGRWHDCSLNWDYPLDPEPWRQAESDLFNQESKLLFQLCCTELPLYISLIYKQSGIDEDPDLDRNLVDKKISSVNPLRHFFNFIQKFKSK